MKITYNPQVDVLSIFFKETKIFQSDPEKTDLILDYDQEGNIVKLSIMNASTQIVNLDDVEYSIITGKTEVDQEGKDQDTLSLADRRAFLKLPLAERRRILSQQVADLVDHYQQNTEWKELLAGDIIDY
jgi:uncharacterized protein YuzE